MACTITADNGSTSGSAGLKSAADSTGALSIKVGSGSVTAAAIDSSGNVVWGSGSGTKSFELTSTDTAAYFQATGASGAGNVRVRLQANATTAQVGTISAHNLVIQTSSTDQATFDTSGNFTLANGQIAVATNGTGTSAQLKLRRPSGSFDFYLQVGGSGELIFVSGAGSNLANINGSTGVYTAVSDQRRKKDLDYSFDALSVISQMRPVMGRFIHEDESAPKRPMFIAQNEQATIPSAVTPLSMLDEDPTLGFDYSAPTPLLVKAVQELAAQNTELKQRIAALEAK